MYTLSIACTLLSPYVYILEPFSAINVQTFVHNFVQVTIGLAALSYKMVASAEKHTLPEERQTWQAHW